MNSNGYRRFKSRLDYFLMDNEFVDIVFKNRELLKCDDGIFNGVDAKKHPLLFVRKNHPNSRKLVVSHLRKTIYVSFIKDMYEEVNEYLRYILKQGAMHGADTNRLVGEQKISMMANDILSSVSKEAIVQTIMNQIFQDLENKRSTIELLRKIKEKLGLGIDDNLLKQALPFLEVRHVFVHSDGKPNQDFIRKYPNMKLDAHHRIELNAIWIKNAYDAINKLLMAIDEEMIEKGYIPKSELQSYSKIKS